MQINRRVLFTISILFFTLYAKAEDTVCIAPIVCYNADNKKEWRFENPNAIIEKALNQYLLGGLIKFRVLSESDYGNVASVTDAERVCAVSSHRYVMYGYIRMSNVSWTGELRLYDHMESQIVQSFFAADDIQHYDRFLCVFVERVVEYFNVFLGLEKDDRTLKSLRPLEIRLPFCISYWSPIEERWNDRLLGIVGADVGVEFFPKMKKFIRRDMSVEFSFGVMMGYKFGIGNPAAYKAGYHSFSFASPIMCYLCYNDPHSMFLGFGPTYEVDILAIDKKYEKTETYVQNQYGMNMYVGYRYRLNDDWSLFTNVEVNMYFTENSFTGIKPNFGATYRLHTGDL